MYLNHDVSSFKSPLKILQRLDNLQKARVLDWGLLGGRNTGIVLFSRRNSEEWDIFWRISEIGTLADTEIFILTDI